MLSVVLCTTVVYNNTHTHTHVSTSYILHVSLHVYLGFVLYVFFRVSLGHFVLVLLAFVLLGLVSSVLCIIRKEIG